MKRRFESALACAAACLAAVPAAAQKDPDPMVQVRMRDAQGKALGTVQLRQLVHGVVLAADLKGLPPGAHGFHIHERGACEGPDFKSAGGHYSPRGREHGFDSARGHHVGDLPNLHAASDGTARGEFQSALVTLVPHASTPDSTGARIACGVIAAPR